MSFVRRIPSGHRTVFFLSFVVALAFAAYTNHVWEDYYITYRASKNLATGHGLVFNDGDRLHTFTSPLGVLLPALASALTLNRSDTIALWIFRFISAAAFAGATTFLYATVLQLGRSLLLAALAAAWLTLDAKSLDFTINGMETGLLLLFIAWTIWAQFGECSRRWLWLGIGWAGLMWTRPDGFLYIGLLAAGGWLFNDERRTGLARVQWLRIFLFAGLVCTAIYLPWFIGSWIYYGTPVPHTISAKSAVIVDARTLSGALQLALTLPVKLWTGTTALPDTFLPAYHMMGGWPAIFLPVGRTLGFFAAFAWLIPFLDRPTRAASFAFFGFHVYLNYYPYFPFPWYLPGTTLLGYFVIAGLVAALSRIAQRRAASTLPRLRLTAVAVIPALLLVGFNVWSSMGVARQLAAQQNWIENANRRKIGEWLREQASPGDRVFLEPLGYIGYFSGLKTYDFPGMSSREVVDATRRLGGDWAPLIDYLGPEWVVLRPIEVDRVNKSYPLLLSSTYRQVHEFNVLDDVKKLTVAGRPYLEFDACFRVFRRERPNRFPSDMGEFRDQFPISVVTIESRQMQLVHAPGTWIVNVPAGARHGNLVYGFPPGAYDGDPKTDGATFTIKLVDGTREQVLLTRQIDPINRLKDRGLQEFNIELTDNSGRLQLHLSTITGPTNTNDWTSWGRPEFW